MTEKGLFISLEGCEGAGKSSQVPLLVKWFTAQGRQTLVTRQPGGTPLGQQIRELLLSQTDFPPVSRAEMFLFMADRAQHCDQIIWPALAQGQVVICDRYADSTLAYQGYGRGQDRDWIQTLNSLATSNLQPDLTLLLDVDPEIGLNRRAAAGGGNRFETEALLFHDRVRNGFLSLAQKEPKRIKVVDAGQPFEQVHAQILEILEAKFNTKSESPDTDAEAEEMRTVEFLIKSGHFRA